MSKKKTPKITIVTPSYNQGDFLEETILSVLGQGYENLEYIVIDGGSTDASVEIIKKHEKHIAYWQSQPDNGQSSAINLGFSKATGEILGWLNSDDVYLPGALKHIATQLDVSKQEILFGNCSHLYENRPICMGSDVRKTFQRVNIKFQDFIIQPSSFWTSIVWNKVGILDENLHYAFDWDWFIRAEKMNVAFKPTDKYLSVYRIHDNHKSGTGGDTRTKEIIKIYEDHLSQDGAKAAKKIANRKNLFNIIARARLPSRLHPLRPYLFKACFPWALRNVSIQDISGIVSMV